MVHFVGVLSGCVVLKQIGFAGKRFVLEDFYAFATASILFTGLSSRPQLSYLVLEMNQPYELVSTHKSKALKLPPRPSWAV
jgi:hypothetical protein